MVDISEYMKNYRPELHAIIFDWGNTIMRVFPDQPGPMAFWPLVQCEAEINNVLSALHGMYQLALCTNASDSDQRLVREALARVELEHYFDEVLTPHELKAFKPAPDFFFNALKKIEVEPERAIFIGDDYTNDIVAAKQIGLWTVWYNNRRQPIEIGGYPYHDIEIAHLSEILSFIHHKFNQRA
ncbi:MAG: HAD family hydrolase [Candidatus Zhuqueibacterota bacterium]